MPTEVFFTPLEQGAAAPAGDDGAGTEHARAAVLRGPSLDQALKAGEKGLMLFETSPGTTRSAIDFPAGSGTVRGVIASARDWPRDAESAGYPKLR